MHEPNGVPLNVDALPAHCCVEAQVVGTESGPTAVRFRAMEERYLRRGRFRARVYGFTDWYALPVTDPIYLRWTELVALPLDDDDDYFDEDLSGEYRELKRRGAGMLVGMAAAVVLALFVGVQLRPSNVLFGALIGMCLGVLGPWIGGAYAVRPRPGEGMYDDDDDESEDA